MDDFCLNLNCDENSEGYKTHFNSMLICEDHFGLSLLPQNPLNNGHKMMCFVQGKIQTSEGLEDKWVPKNSFKYLPHLLQKKLYFQNRVLNNLGEDHLALVKGNFDGSNFNQENSLMENIELVENISVNFGSEQDSINSEYKYPAPGYEHLIDKEDSLANINLEDLEKDTESEHYTENEESEDQEDSLSEEIEIDEGELSDENFEIELV